MNDWSALAPTTLSLSPARRPLYAAVFLFVIPLLVTISRSTPHATAAPPPAPVSRVNRASISGGGNSFAPSFSADGRFLVFVSQAKNLATNGLSSPYLDVFARDLNSGQTVLVSVNASALGGGNDDSNLPTISSNCQFVAFESEASNLVGNDTNHSSDVFVRDLRAATTTLLSVDTNGVQSGVHASHTAMISADGRRVVFVSAASNLVTNDFNGFGSDIFVRDLVAGTTTLVSVNADGTGSPVTAFFSTTVSESATVSVDGRHVAFWSIATNVVTATTNRHGEIFVRDIDNGVTIWASAGAATYFPTSVTNIANYNPVISANGRYVAFVSGEVPLTIRPLLLLRYDIQGGVTTLVASNALVFTFAFGDSISHPISADGRFVAFQTTDALMLADVASGTQEVVCGEGVLAGVVAWRAPVMSPDANRVAFLGAASTNGPWSVYLYDRQKGTRDLISVTTNGSPAEIVPVSEPALSADGRRIAFESAADNIVPDDLNRAADIFWRDLDAGVAQLVSARAPDRPSVTPTRRSFIGPKCVSEFGRFIAFTSLDDQLVEADDNPWQDAFVRDMITGTTQVLHLPGTDYLGSTRLAFNPMLSRNGRYLAWLEEPMPLPVASATATNISWLDRETGNSAVVNFAGATLGGPGIALSEDGRWLAFADRLPSSPYTQVFIRDLFTPNTTNQLISINRFGTGGGNGDSTTPVFGPDGRWIVFLSKASDLATNSAFSGVAQVFARNLSTGQTRMLSTDVSGRFGLTFGGSNALFSADSRFVFFFAASPLGVIFRHDLHTTNTSVLVATGGPNYSVSLDGRFLAHERLTAFTKDIYLDDLRTGLSVLVSTNVLGSPDIGGNGNSYSPQISSDGRYVVFASRADNLVSDDTNHTTDIFVYDRAQRATLLVSRGSQTGGPANALSTLPVLAPDGRTIVFASFASDLAPGDFSTARDIYVLRLGGPDTDADGLDDEWEMAYFDTLSRDGTGDFDGDGSTDLQEFRAGTDPTDRASILRVLTIDSLDGSSRTILWTAQPGRSYRVQFKRDVTDPDWTDLPGIVSSTGTTGSKEDTSAVGEVRRFYRVVLEL